MITNADNYFVEHISVAASAALKKICLGQSIDCYDTDPGSLELPITMVTRLPSPFDENELELWNVEFWRLKKLK